MLNDNIARALENSITAEYEKIEYELFSSVVTSLAKDSVGVNDIAYWRKSKLSELANYKKDWAKQLQKLSQSSLPEVKKTIQESLQNSVDLDDKALSKVQKLAQQVTSLNTPEAFSTRLKSAIKHSIDGINLTNTKAIAQAQKDYLQMVNTAYTRVLSGVDTLDQALRSVSNQYAKVGATVEYVTSTGKVMHYNLVDSVRRDILTTVNQTASELSIDKCNEYGTDLVEVSAHSGARPEHARWQGQVYSLSGKTKGYRSLADATEYGSASGLCGVNCRHTFWPYFAGYSKQTDHSDLPGLRENDELYAKQQQQRAYEREMRKLKRQESSASISGDKSSARMYKNKLSKTRKEYLDYIEKNGLTRQTARENPHISEAQKKDVANAVKEQYERSVKVLGKNAPDSFDGYIAIMNSEDYKTFTEYLRLEEIHELSNDTSFQIYKETLNLLKKELVGTTTGNGYVIKEVSYHFVARHIGSKDQKRLGVSLEAIKETLSDSNPKKRIDKERGDSFTYNTGKGTQVSMNTNGRLIQCNPSKRKKQ